VFKGIREDIATMRARDPAAGSWLEVLLCYPGLHAVWLHRASHWLWRHRVRLLARVFSHCVRWGTGVEIHPGARLGRRVTVDHGMGVVIGETAEVGNDVHLYSGVVLGGVSRKPVKRHPTVGDGVLIGAGAMLLGPIRVGEGARIGAGVVVRSDVPAGAVVVAPSPVIQPSPENGNAADPQRQELNSRTASDRSATS
jgi:serine O-acetyltransferase